MDSKILSDGNGDGLNLIVISFLNSGMMKLLIES